MDSIHESPTRFCRFLNESFFAELYDAFLRAFSDYEMPFDLTTTQFRNHLLVNAVDLEGSVGWIYDGQIVGFTLNGLGDWQGIPTVYDAGTGVLPEFRRRGLSLKMFRMMMPVFSNKGYRQFLLEVITTNENAIGLYRKLGFQVIRTLSLLHCLDKLSFRDDLPTGFEIREIVDPDWDVLKTFWDGEPSWQNSCDAVDRSRDKKLFIGVFSKEKCFGYIVFSANVGRIAQLAVDPAHRRRGIGKLLMQAMSDQMSPDHVPQVINIDRSIESAMTFFANRGFTEKLSQFEMLHRF